MAFYPEGKFIREFAKRTAANLQSIDAKTPLEFTDTALISSLLAVFVMPHERTGADGFMAEILHGYGRDNLEDVVKVLRPKPGEEGGEDIESELPRSLAEVPRFLRNAVAHLNIKPLSKDELRLTHLLIWNRNPHKNDKITFVAEVSIEKLKPLALHVLGQLAERDVGDRYNGIDPIEEYDKVHPAELAPL